VSRKTVAPSTPKSVHRTGNVARFLTEGATNCAGGPAPIAFLLQYPHKRIGSVVDGASLSRRQRNEPLRRWRRRSVGSFPAALRRCSIAPPAPAPACLQPRAWHGRACAHRGRSVLHCYWARTIGGTSMPSVAEPTWYKRVGGHLLKNRALTRLVLNIFALRCSGHAAAGNSRQHKTRVFISYSRVDGAFAEKPAARTDV
jgi:hypothetical protein